MMFYGIVVWPEMDGRSPELIIGHSREEIRARVTAIIGMDPDYFDGGFSTYAADHENVHDVRPFPRRDDNGKPYWACCISSIGPTCEHKAPRKRFGASRYALRMAREARLQGIPDVARYYMELARRYRLQAVGYLGV